MPVLVIPLILNTMVSGAIWISCLATTFKVLLTTANAVTFAVFVYSVFLCDIKWLKYSSFIGCISVNAALIVLGLIHAAEGLVVLPSALITMLFLWVILQRVLMIEKKEGSR